MGIAGVAGLAAIPIASPPKFSTASSTRRRRGPDWLQPLAQPRPSQGAEFRVVPELSRPFGQPKVPDSMQKSSEIRACYSVLPRTHGAFPPRTLCALEQRDPLVRCAGGYCCGPSLDHHYDGYVHDTGAGRTYCVTWCSSGHSAQKSRHHESWAIRGVLPGRRRRGDACANRSRSCLGARSMRA